MDDYDIVIINSNFSKRHEDKHVCHPLGILYLGAVLLRKGYKVKVIDCNFPPKSIEELESEISDLKTSFFAISSLSGGYAYTKRIVQILKKHFPECQVVLGGPINQGIAGYIMEKTGVDMAVEGEAETIISDLLDAALTRGAAPEIPGVFHKKDGEIIPPSEKQVVVNDLSTLPFPAWDLIDADIYTKNLIHGMHSENKRSFPVMASRGCPYGCNFCCRTLGGKLRTRGADIIEEIELIIRKYSVDDICFLDEEFAVDEKRAFEMCDFLERLSTPVSFVCSMRVDCVTPEILSRMKRTGFRRIIYGVESGSNAILKKMNKGFTTEQARRAILETRKHGIEAYVNFMIGYPGETESTFRETVEFMKELRLYSNFSISTPLPGSKWFQQCIAGKLIDDIDSYLELFDRDMTNTFAVNFSSLPLERLLELKKQAEEETFSNRIVLKS